MIERIKEAISTFVTGKEEEKEGRSRKEVGEEYMGRGKLICP